MYDEALKKDQETGIEQFKTDYKVEHFPESLIQLRKKMSDSEKLKKLKEIRRKNLERNFLEVQMKGQDHYVFIKDNGKAQVIYDEGRWVTEHIRTSILKFNYEIDKINKLLVRDFTQDELNEYEKTFSKDV